MRTGAPATVRAPSAYHRKFNLKPTPCSGSLSLAGSSRLPSRPRSRLCPRVQRTPRARCVRRPRPAKGPHRASRGRDRRRRRTRSQPPPPGSAPPQTCPPAGHPGATTAGPRRSTLPPGWSEAERETAALGAGVEAHRGARPPFPRQRVPVHHAPPAEHLGGPALRLVSVAQPAAEFEPDACFAVSAVVEQPDLSPRAESTSGGKRLLVGGLDRQS